MATHPPPLAVCLHLPCASQRGAPLRKGKLLAQSSSARRSEPGAAAVASTGATPRDPGMVLPVPTASQGSAGAAGTASVVSSPTASAAAAPAASDGTSAAPAASADAAAPPAEAPKPAPSPLDLLSGLDFNFEPAAPAAPAAPAGPGAGSNPFADMAPMAAAPAAAAVGSNPFGEPAAPPAAPAGFDWPAPAPAPTQPAWQQQQQQQFAPATHAPQQPAAGFYGGAGGYAMPSDDPFASFGAPSPAAPAPVAYGAPSPAGAGAFWGTSAGAVAAPTYPTAGALWVWLTLRASGRCVKRLGAAACLDGLLLQLLRLLPPSLPLLPPSLQACPSQRHQAWPATSCTKLR